MSILDVQHQPAAHRVLQRSLRSGRMPHAYIFHGPSGIGKGMLAERLARLLLCSRPREVTLSAEDADETTSTVGTDACQTCADCGLAGAGTHPDIHRVHRELNRYHPDEAVRKRKAVNLSVDVLRHFLIAPAAGKPSRGRAKVFIVDEAERMSTGAQNALLKTLEEPPATTYLILLTRSIDRLLPTTRSRCQPVRFRRLPVDFITEQLRAQRENVSTETARYLARFCDGRLGTALQAYDDGIHELKADIGSRLARLGSADGIRLAKDLIDTGKTLAERAKERHADASDTELTRIGLRTLIAMAAEFYRDALRRSVGTGEGLTNVDQESVIDALARRTGADGAADAIRALTTAETHLEQNANVQLTIEALGIGLCRAGAPAHARG